MFESRSFRRRILPILGLVVASLRPAWGTTLRVVDYNCDCSDQGNNNAITNGQIPAIMQAIGNHHIGSNAQPADIIALTEMLDTNNNSITSTTLPALVTALNNIYGAGTYAYDTTPDPTTGGTSTNGPSGLIYNTHTVQVLSATNLPWGSVSGASIPRAPMRYQLQPVGYGANASFYMYVSHYKSGSGTTNTNDRTAEATEIRSNADALGASAHIIYTGDMNLFGDSAEPAYTTLLAAGNGQAHDVGAPSGWTSSNSTLSYIDTETATSLKYRDDVQLVSNATLTQPGLQLAADTSDPYDPRNFPSAKYAYALEVFGNNGSTAYGASTNLSTNTSLNDLSNASTIRSYLSSASDHLPVIADYNLVGVNPLPANLTWKNTGGTGDGVTWDTAVSQNWNNGSGPALFHAGDTVTFNDSNNGHYAVTIAGTNAPASVTVNNSAGNYIFSGTGSITGAASLSKAGTGSLTIATGNSYSGGTIVGAGTVVIANSAALGTGAITIHNGATVQLQPGLAKGVIVPAVQLDGATGAWLGTLDITSDTLVVQDSTTHAATFGRLQNQALFGMTHSTGIVSTTLAANLGIAVIDNGALSTPYTSFGGVSVDLNSILIAPALLGDANGDGHVDATDLSLVFNNFAMSTSNWSSGNFDGAATIDLTDLADVLNNFGLSSPAAAAAAAPITTASPAPEPASLALTMLALPALLKRRSRTA